MAGETAEVTHTIDAEPERVWAVVGDVTRMPDWSQDLESVDLLEGDGRSVGSTFRGNNKDQWRTWSMTCVIDRYEDGHALEFHTENAEGEIRTRWWYRLEPATTGTAVTEGFYRVFEMPPQMAEGERKMLGDRTEHNVRNMRGSLERLAQAVAGG